MRAIARPRSAAAALAGVAVLLLVGCGSGSAARTVHESSSTAVSAAPGAVGPAAPSGDQPSPTAALVTLRAPADRSKVARCAVFEGAAHLAPGQTIALGLKNLSNGDGNHYYELIHDWESAAERPAWEGYLWFGSDVNLSGQAYRVDVLVLTVDVARAALAAAGTRTTGWHSTALPQGARVVTGVELERTAGPGPAVCN